MDTDRIERDCADDIKLLHNRTADLTAFGELSIALGRSVRQRQRLVEENKRLRAQLEANRETQ